MRSLSWLEENWKLSSTKEEFMEADYGTTKRYG